MWWSKYRGILDYLTRSKDNKKIKELVLSNRKNKYQFREEIRKLRGEEKLHYLFDENLIEKAKKIIIEEIEQLFRYSYSHEEEISNIIKILGYKKITEEELKTLFKKYGINIINRTLCNNLYKEDLIDLVKSEDISTETKKIIIALNIDENVIDSIERELTSYKNTDEIFKLLDYIAKEIPYSPSELDGLIYSGKISVSTKCKIIEYHVNSTNVLNLIRNTHDTESNFIIETKSKEIDKCLRNLNEEELIRWLLTYKNNKKVSKLILERRKDTITKIIKKTKNEDLYALIQKTFNEELVNLIYTLRKEDLNKGLLQVDSKELIQILSLFILTDETKQFILDHRLNDVKKEIKELGVTASLELINNNYTLEDLRFLIITIKKDDIKEYIRRMPNNTIRDLINSTNTYEPYRLLLIESGLNEHNILDFIKDTKNNPDRIKQVINSRNDLIREILKNKSIREITLLSKEIMPEYLEFIIIKNEDVIRRIIEKEAFDKEEAANLLINDEINPEFKKIVLKTLKINENELETVIDLIISGGSVLIINRYNDIKNFINSLNVSFEAFIQYGSGSGRYNKWLPQILDIIDNNKRKEFMMVSSYFFRNYYDKDTEKENSVYIINNLLQILDSYSKYYTLCMSLVQNNISLSEEDKRDLKFLFSMNDTQEINSIDDLKGLRKKTFMLYKDLLETGKIHDMSIYEIKGIFNNVIFSNTVDSIRKIKGMEGLEALKKYNSESKLITSYIEEIMKYVKVIEVVENSTDKESLIRVLSDIFGGTYEDFLSLQDEYNNLNNKINRLYELDSQVNLTSISDALKKEGVINEELSKKYGGYVLDFSDKNYCLYAHVLSRSETPDIVVNGLSTGKRNFLSLSPISYYGQKYYYDHASNIFLYDNIKRGSFICSSKENMGSNRHIKNNSSEVSDLFVLQKGILETSSATTRNAEALLYREGLTPSAIALPGGREPTSEELMYHQKYNLPFVITQEPKTPIENVKKVFTPRTEYNEPIIRNKKIEKVLRILCPKINIIKEDKEYTGREIGLFTDSHALYEPTLAVLEDMRKNGITEIYSLGDNIGLGPSPSEVIDMLEHYKVKSVMGNSEYYNTLGTKPFIYFDFNTVREENQEWTKDKLGSKRIEKMRLWRPSIDLKIGNKKIALCHFANDIRWDYTNNSTHVYQATLKEKGNGRQFLYTNSEAAQRHMKEQIDRSYDKDRIRGVLDAQKHPLFDGKRITDYDSIIQGHVHFDLQDQVGNTKILTLRGTGIGYNPGEREYACYYILKEKKDGSVEIVKKLVPYNKAIMDASIKSSSLPHKEPILKMTK